MLLMHILIILIKTKENQIGVKNGVIVLLYININSQLEDGFYFNLYF